MSDKDILLEFVKKYKYLAYTTDVTSVYIDKTVRDPNDGILDSREKYRCGNLGSWGIVIYSSAGILSTNSETAALSFLTQETCERYLFERFEEATLDQLVIFNPCINPATLECQELQIGL